MGKTFKHSSSKWDDDDWTDDELSLEETDNRKVKKFKKLRESRRKKQTHNDDLIENRDNVDDRSN